MPPRRVLGDVIVFAVLAAAYAWSASRFHAAYPEGYSWSEMLINYQGGLLRRGLVGELAYRLNPVVPARLFVTGLLYASYMGAIGYLVFGLRLARSLSGLALLVSPLGLLFAAHLPVAFGRKDVFILAAALASLWVVRMSARPFAALAAILAAYSLTSFIIEVDWFYLPLIGAAFVTRYRARLKGTPLAAAAAIAVAVAGTMAWFAYTMSAHADLGMMRASWAATYPGLWDAALCCVAQPLGMAVKLGTGALADRTLLTGYLIGAALGLLPLALLVAERRIEDMGDRLVLLAWVVGVLCSAAPIFLAADWGRYIHLSLTHVFLAAVALNPVRRAYPPAISARGLILAGAFLFLYATSWTLLHFQVPGQSPLEPGPLFWATGHVPPVPR